MWAALSIAFGVIPYVIINKRFHVKKEDLGIQRFRKTDYVLITGVGIYILVLLAYKRNVTELFVIGIQQLGVCLAEEFLCRGIICYLLGKMTKNKYLIAIVSGAIFAMIIHTGGQTLDNLLYRFPAGILLGIVYLKSKRLYPSVILHLIYNLYCIYL